ncbi:FHA domain-containing protein, partial [Desertihabitans aurantiacus]|uniref:FHA domain-containing protein n=1 Tax=Desertihabitans aurantiacus TaxID=2282477 RepID=UPI0013001D17
PPAPVPSAPVPSAPEAPTEVAPAATDEAGWVAEIWIDPDWYALQNSADPMPSPGPPEVVVLRGRSLLVGRVSRSRNIHPDISCEADSGVSRRQAQLTSDGSRWFVEDLGSANGTFVGPASGPLPERPVPVGQRVEVGPDDRVYVGAWTRMVIRRATAGEGGDAS